MEHPFFIFWIKIFKKIIITFTSVKVWGLFGLTYVNFWLLVNDYLKSTDFATIQVTLITVIFGMREVFKTSNIEAIGNAIKKIKEKVKDNKDES